MKRKTLRLVLLLRLGKEVREPFPKTGDINADRHARICRLSRNIAEIRDRHAAGYSSFGLDVDVVVSEGEKLRTDKGSECHYVVQVRLVGSLDGSSSHIIKNSCCRLGVPASTSANSLKNSIRQFRLKGHVETDHGQIAPRFEDSAGGLRIAVDVELGRNGHVAA